MMMDIVQFVEAHYMTLICRIVCQLLMFSDMSSTQSLVFIYDVMYDNVVGVFDVLYDDGGHAYP